MKILDILFRVSQTNDNIIQVLNNVQLFENLSLYDLENLSKVIDVHNFPENHILFKENEMADGLWIIAKGILKIYKNTVEGKEIEIAKLIDNNYFGEMGIIQSDKRTASVKTISESNLYFLSKENFENLLRRNLKTANKILYNISRMLSQRLSESNVRYITKI
jgi:CRP/FNR family transcriptional regulator, cyclic AMP receptor protein